MAVKNISLEEAGEQVAKLVAMVEEGDELIISQGEEPRAKLVAIPKAEKQKRVLGRHRGQIWMSDDFNDPLPDEFWLGGNP